MRKRPRIKRKERKSDIKGLLIPFLFVLTLSGCSGENNIDRVIGRTISFFSPRIEEKPVAVSPSHIEIAAQVQPKTDISFTDSILDTMKIDTVKDILAALNWEKFYYSPRGKQDPFTPLITKEKIRQGLHPEQGELVGIIWGPKGYLALVKEKGGSAFVLQEGDRVVNGYVEKIDRNSVTFRMKQFGVVSKIVLHLKEGEGEK